MRRLALIVFILGLLILCLIGTGTHMLFAWPGYFVLGLSGVLGVFAWVGDTRVRANDVCLLSAVLLTAYLIIRGLTSPVVYLAREDLLLVCACLIVYAAGALQFTRPRERAAVMWILLALGMVNFVIGLYHGSGHPEYSIVPGYERTYPEGRVGGLFNNPNHMAAFVSFVVMLAISFALFGRGGAAKKLVLLFCVGMMIIAMIMTVSRGALLAFGVGLIVLTVLGLWMAREMYRPLFKRLMILVLVPLVIALLVGGGLVVSALMGRQGSMEAAFNDPVRPYFWKAAVEQFSEAPLMGTGSRTYYYLSRKYRPIGLYFETSEIEHTHNDFLELLAEYGIIGAGLFAVFGLVHGVYGLRYLGWFRREEYPRTGRRTGTQLALVMGSLAGLACGAAHAVLDFHAHIPAVAVLYAFGMGILANPGFRPEDHRPARIRGVRVLLGLGATAAGLMFVYQFFFFGAAEYQLEKALRNQDDRINLENTVYFSKAKKLDPSNHRIYFASGMGWLGGLREDMPTALKASLLRKALAEFQEANRLFPQDVYILMAIGNCLDGLGMPEAAEAPYLSAIEWAPNYQETRLSYAIHLHRVGRFEEAEKAYAHARLGHPLRHHDETRPYIDSLVKRLEEDRKRAEEEKGTPDSDLQPIQ